MNEIIRILMMFRGQVRKRISVSLSEMILIQGEYGRNETKNGNLVRCVTLLRLCMFTRSNFD